MKKNNSVFISTSNKEKNRIKLKKIKLITVINSPPFWLSTIEKILVPKKFSRFMIMFSTFGNFSVQQLQ